MIIYDNARKNVRWVEMQEYLDAGGPPNFELANDTFNVGKGIYIVTSIVRILVFLASCVRPRFSKYIIAINALH